MQAAPIPQAPLEPYVDVKVPSQGELVEQVTSEELQESPAPEPNALQDLEEVDRLFVTKRLRVRDALTLRGKRNRYLVRTPDQKLLYTVEEENSWWTGYFCFGLRPLRLRVFNGGGTEVLTIDRPFACTSRVLPCQMQRIDVSVPSRGHIGSVEQQWAPLRPLYLVRRENGEQVLWIRGPRVTVSCFRDVQFHILRPDGRPVGGTCKRWRGLLHAMLLAPHTDRFGVAFDRDLVAEEKALLLAATLLTDYMYYDG